MADAHHAEWLSLLDISGPFLSPPVLDRVFPQGLDAADPDHTAKLRLAYEEWAEEQQKADPDPAIHDAWIRFILTETLGLTPEVLLEGEGVPEELEFSSPEHGETIRPDFVVFDPEDEPGTRKPRLLISVWPADTELDQPVDDARWTASPIDRMITLCRSEPVGLRLGLVTNGERWALVDAPVGETSAHASWYANLWGPEPLTLRAFRSLLGLRRFFGVAEGDRLEAMLVESANYQTEVTDQLGFQVRRAVEVLVQAIDRADADTGRTLLADTDPARIYEAALTVMMRLVFLFSAEERGLLRLGDPMYDQFYAVSTLHAQLQEAADLVGPEVLERRQDAWSRLLGTFRAIYGGVHHQDLQIIPYGSSLFDPDRFPFLEGRTDDTAWQDTDSLPLPIDNRTVLLLLRSLQMLDLGKGKGARKLSFRALDIEQIGHVYETLLDHSAYRATEPMVSLQGNQSREPEVPVSKLIDLMLQEGDEPLVEFLRVKLKKGVNPIRKALEKGRTPEPEAVARLRRACGGDDVLLGKLLPFQNLIRLDPWGDPVVIREGAVFVTAGEDRRSTGTHYTPRALTEEIVQYALEPVVYRGPAEGKDREEWELKTPEEILDLKVCDPAMGSGAFLVQACRYLSERLVEAWEATAEGSVNAVRAVALPKDPEERLSLARRLVADRCLYGVDVNPLAVEMAKLSIWLITLAADTPFSFLDHALKCGDSLLGVHDLQQVRQFHPEPRAGIGLHESLFDPRGQVDTAITLAASLRAELEQSLVRDTYDAQQKKDLFLQAQQATDSVRLLGDLVAGAALAEDGPDSHLLSASSPVLRLLAKDDPSAVRELERRAYDLLNQHDHPKASTRRPFHWPIEFPEVYERSVSGFDSIVGNPPFLGNKYWRGRLGADAQMLAKSVLGKPARRIDLAVVFHKRGLDLVGEGGTTGLLATTSIAEGDAVAACYGSTPHSSQITMARRAFRWPGTANVTVAIVWTSSGPYEGSYTLDGATVNGITARLLPESRVLGRPSILDHGLYAFAGVDNTRGLSLVVAEDDPWCATLIREGGSLFRRYVTGDDITTRAMRLDRWVIDTRDMAWHEVVDSAPVVAEFLMERVKPSRTAAELRQYPDLVERWWQFWRVRGAQYLELRRDEDCLAIPKVSKYVLAVRAPTKHCYTNKVFVVRLDRPDLHTLLLSSLFEAWVFRYSGTMGQTLSVSLREALLTFPLPDGAAVSELAAEWQTMAERWCGVHGAGYTALLNAVRAEESPDRVVVRLRELTETIDSSVANAYGWDDLDLRRRCQRGAYGIRADVETEALDRLLELNLERGAHEDVGRTNASKSVSSTEVTGDRLFS